MRVLLSVPWFYPEAGGGGQTYVLQVAKELQRLGHDVCVLTGVKKAGGQGTEDGAESPPRPIAALFQLLHYSYNGVQVVALEPSPGAVRWQEAIAEIGSVFLDGLGKVLDEFKPDVVHLNGFKPALTQLCSERDIPFLVTAHHPGVVCPAGLRLNEEGEVCEEVAQAGVCVRCCCIQRSGSRAIGALLAALPDGLSRAAVWGTGWKGPPGKAVRAVAYPEAIRRSLASKALVWERAPLWIAPSHAIRAHLLRQGIPEERIVHIPHGIEPVQGVPPMASARGVVRFGYLGGYSYVKGLHVLVEALSRLKNLELCELHVFGKASSPWDEKYEAATVRGYAGRARLVSHEPVPRERIAEAYGAFDVLVVPSLCPEVFGLVVLEAFTAGRPVIVSDAGALPELVCDGVDGLVVPHGDAAALARAMDDLVSAPERILELIANIPQIRTVSQHVDDLLMAYGKLIGNGHDKR